MMYTFATPESLHEMVRRNINGLATALAICLILAFFPYLLIYLFPPVKEGVLDLYYLISFGSLSLALASLYGIHKVKNFTDKELPLAISVEEDKLVCTTIEGFTEYTFEALQRCFEVRLTFFYGGTARRYPSVKEFLSAVIGDIEEGLKKSHGKVDEEVISINFAKSRRAFPSLLFFYMFLSQTGGFEGIKKFLDEFRTKYEAYCERKQTVEGVTSLKKEEENKAGDLRGILFWAGVISLSIITLVFLSLIPYLRTSPSSQSYSTNLVLFVIDSFVTFMVVWLGLAKILRLRKKDTGK